MAYWRQKYIFFCFIEDSWQHRKEIRIRFGPIRERNLLEDFMRLSSQDLVDIIAILPLNCVVRLLSLVISYGFEWKFVLFCCVLSRIGKLSSLKSLKKLVKEFCLVIVKSGKSNLVFILVSDLVFWNHFNFSNLEYSVSLVLKYDFVKVKRAEIHVGETRWAQS